MDPRPTVACLDDDALAALAGGEPASPAELEHLAHCSQCAARVAALSRLLQSHEVSAELRALEAPSGAAAWRSRLIRVAGGLAAAAVLVLAIRAGLGPGRHAAQLREQPVTLVSPPIPLQPSGAVTRVDSLSWRSVSRATQYRVTLFAQDGSTVWDTSSADTVVVLAPGIALAPGAVYYWKVEARTDWNRWTASELIEIRIAGR
jgi:hypothetical protein